MNKTRGGYKWASHGRTESGDDLPIVLWDHPPGDEEVDAWYENWSPEEYSEVGFVLWTVDEVEYAS